MKKYIEQICGAAIYILLGFTIFFILMKIWDVISMWERGVLIMKEFLETYGELIIEVFGCLIIISIAYGLYNTGALSGLINMLFGRVV